MDNIAGAILDLGKKPLPGDIFHLGDGAYVTVVSIADGQLKYVPDAVDLSTFLDAPEDLLRRAAVMPYKTFRKWLASMAAGRRMDTPPPS